MAHQVNKHFVNVGIIRKQAVVKAPLTVFTFKDYSINNAYIKKYELQKP